MRAAFSGTSLLRQLEDENEELLRRLRHAEAEVVDLTRQLRSRDNALEAIINGEATTRNELEQARQVAEADRLSAARMKLQRKNAELAAHLDGSHRIVKVQGDALGRLTLRAEEAEAARAAAEAAATTVKDEARVAAATAAQADRRYAALTHEYELLDRRLREHEAAAAAHVDEWLYERQRLKVQLSEAKANNATLRRNLESHKRRAGMAQQRLQLITSSLRAAGGAAMLQGEDAAGSVTNSVRVTVSTVCPSVAGGAGEEGDAVQLESEMVPYELYAALEAEVRSLRSKIELQRRTRSPPRRTPATVNRSSTVIAASNRLTNPAKTADAAMAAVAAVAASSPAPALTPNPRSGPSPALAADHSPTADRTRQMAAAAAAALAAAAAAASPPLRPSPVAATSPPNGHACASTPSPPSTQARTAAEAMRSATQAPKTGPPQKSSPPQRRQSPWGKLPVAWRR